MIIAWKCRVYLNTNCPASTAKSLSVFSIPPLLQFAKITTKIYELSVFDIFEIKNILFSSHNHEQVIKCFLENEIDHVVFAYF